MVSAYIPNYSDNTVSVIDTSTDTVLTTITVGNNPIAVSVSTDGSKAYVSNYLGSTISVINTSTNSVSATFYADYAPQGLAVSPDGSKLYVTNVDNLGHGTLSVFNALTNTLTTTIAIPGEPEGVAFTPDGTKAYVTNTSVNDVYVIDVASNTVSTIITTSIGSEPIGIAISPDGSKGYVINYYNNDVSVINISTNTVSNIISVGTGPIGVAFTPDSTKAYVANSGSNTISVIDVATSTVLTTVTVGNGSNGVSVTPDGTKAYVSNSGTNTVSVINTSTDTVSTTVTVGHHPSAIGISIQPPTQSTGADMPAPQGRLTLSSTSPVMTADAAAQSTIYYLPYQGNIVPVYSGAAFVNQLLGSSGISLALDSNSAHTGYQASGSLFDIFAFLNSGTLTLATGPAWTNSTTRSAAITQVNGIWVNSASITLKYDTSSSTASVSANQATYLGTMYATANGQTGVALRPAAASGGSNNIIGLFNAYNRQRVIARSIESTASWTYNSTTIRAANNSTSNRISFVDGLAQIFSEARYQVEIYPSVQSAFSGVGFNSTTAFTDIVGANNSVSSVQFNSEEGKGGAYPVLGFNYWQALEACNNTSTATYYGTAAASASAAALFLTTEY